MKKGKFLTDVYKKIDNKSYDIKDAINIFVESKREKFGLEAKKQFLKKFLGEKVFRKFMNTINS